MDKNYTPIDLNAFKNAKAIKKSSHESFDVNAIFLCLIVITLGVIAVLLFILIQKKLQELSYVPFFA